MPSASISTGFESRGICFFPRRISNVFPNVRIIRHSNHAPGDLIQGDLIAHMFQHLYPHRFLWSRVRVSRMSSFGLSSCCVCCLRLPDAAAVGFAPCFEFEIGFLGVWFSRRSRRARSYLHSCRANRDSHPRPLTGIPPCVRPLKDPTNKLNPIPLSLIHI